MTTKTDTKKTTEETPAYVYADLPQCHNKALNFYAVYLEEWDGTQYGGAVPCLEFWSDRQFVIDKDDQYEDPGVDFATNAQEFALMESKRKKVKRNKRNRPETRHARGWQHSVYKNRYFFEDQDVAAAGQKPFVRAITLYCPAWGPDGRGGQEQHGVYEGIGSDMAKHPSYTGKPGYCPTCNHEPEQEAKAGREIADLYRAGQREMPAPLQDFVRKTALAGGNA